MGLPTVALDLPSLEAALTGKEAPTLTYESGLGSRGRPV